MLLSNQLHHCSFDGDADAEWPVRDGAITTPGSGNHVTRVSSGRPSVALPRDRIVRGPTRGSSSTRSRFLHWAPGIQGGFFAANDAVEQDHHAATTQVKRRKTPMPGDDNRRRG